MTMIIINWLCFVFCFIVLAGLDMSLSSLSLTSNTRQKDEWMDPKLWGSLSEPLVERILAYLSLPVVLPMRAVCKRWNSLLHTPEFLSTQREISVQCPSYVLMVSEPAYSLFTFFQQGPELYYLRSSSLYCPVSKNWFNMSLGFLPFPDLYITSVGGGLICFVAHRPKISTKNSHREVMIGVCNPATRTWRILPRWRGGRGGGDAKIFNMPTYVAMVVDNFSRSYKVVVIDYDRTHTRIFSSATMLWSAFEEVPTQHNFPYYDRTPTQAVCESGHILVCATQCKTGISTFDMHTGVWESYHVSLPGMHSNVHIVQHHGRILMVSRVMVQKYEGSDKVQISELDRKSNLRVTKPLDDVPLGPSKQFLDHFKVCDFSGLEDSEGLCFVSVTTGERWMYDLEERFWHIMPSSPGSKTKSMAAYGGFSIHLRVDIQP